jgi:DNA mismatch repair protein MutS
LTIPDGVKLTPWLAQYKQWKDEYPDALLLFRMGDFYECFFDDARVVSSTLGIALTSRDPEKSIPMAGIPRHALQGYLARLIRAGHRAAICEQIEGQGAEQGPGPGQGPGKIVARRVVRVITPGTWVPDAENSDEGRSGGDSAGRLAAVMLVKGGGGEARMAVALLVSGTGRLEAGTLSVPEGAAFVSAFNPGELLHPASLKPDDLPPSLRTFAALAQPNEIFRASSAAEHLKSVIGTRSLEGIGLGRASEEDPCVGPAWAVLNYLSSTQFSAVRHVLKITKLKSLEYMYLDEATIKNLEILPEAGDSRNGSLFAALNRCRTPMGRRSLRDWLLRPLMDVAAIAKRQDYIGCLVSDPAVLAALQDALAECRDVERACARLAMGTGTPGDVRAIRDTLRLMPRLRSMTLAEPLAEVLRAFPDLSLLLGYLDEALEEILPNALGQGPVIRSSFDAQLASWREMSENGTTRLDEYLEHERAETGVRLKIGHNSVFGYYLEASRTAALPDRFVRRQTLANAQRFTTPQLREFEDKLNRAASEIERIEAEIFKSIVERVLDDGMNVQLLGRLAGLLDCVASLARAALERGYVRPVVNGGSGLTIRGARHPVLEAMLPFVPNDVDLSTMGGSRIIILTGPNMAGKSTWLRMTALLAVMAQAGSWIPADSGEFGIIDRVFTRIGARDDLTRGNSTFMVEMLETADILNNVTPRSLVILDEVGRGTATWDGMSIAWAVLEYLCEGDSPSWTAPRVLFATHYHELTQMEEHIDGVHNYSMSVSEDSNGIHFLHQVVRGAADKSYGIEVARLAGLPKPVLRRAQELLKIFEEEGVERSSLSRLLEERKSQGTNAPEQLRLY